MFQKIAFSISLVVFLVLAGWLMWLEWNRNEELMISDPLLGASIYAFIVWGILNFMRPTVLWGILKWSFSKIVDTPAGSPSRSSASREPRADIQVSVMREMNGRKHSDRWTTVASGIAINSGLNHQLGTRLNWEESRLRHESNAIGVRVRAVDSRSGAVVDMI
jgi:hypothetical protein